MTDSENLCFEQTNKETDYNILFDCFSVPLEKTGWPFMTTGNSTSNITYTLTPFPEESVQKKLDEILERIATIEKVLLVLISKIII